MARRKGAACRIRRPLSAVAVLLGGLKLMPRSFLVLLRHQQPPLVQRPDNMSELRASKARPRASMTSSIHSLDTQTRLARCCIGISPWWSLLFALPNLPYIRIKIRCPPGRPFLRKLEVIS